jgi:hypothetical protein
MANSFPLVSDNGSWQLAAIHMGFIADTQGALPIPGAGGRPGSERLAVLPAAHQQNHQPQQRAQLNPETTQPRPKFAPIIGTKQPDDTHSLPDTSAGCARMLPLACSRQRSGPKLRHCVWESVPEHSGHDLTEVTVADPPIPSARNR